MTIFVPSYTLWILIFSDNNNGTIRERDCDFSVACGYVRTLVHCYVNTWMVCVLSGIAFGQFDI